MLTPRTSSPCAARSSRSTSTRRSSTTPYGWSPRPGRRPRSGWATCDRYVTYGASPRATHRARSLGGRALAFLRGRDYVLPHDVDELALDVLRHRVVLSYEALADGLDADTVLVRVLRAVRSPDVVLQG